MVQILLQQLLLQPKYNNNVSKNKYKYNYKYNEASVGPRHAVKLVKKRGERMLCSCCCSLQVPFIITMTFVFMMDYVAGYSVIK